MQLTKPKILQQSLWLAEASCVLVCGARQSKYGASKVTVGADSNVMNTQASLEGPTCELSLYEGLQC